MAKWSIIREFKQKDYGTIRTLVEVICSCGYKGVRRKTHVLNGRTRMCKKCASKETAQNYGTPIRFKVEKELFDTFYNAIQTSNLRRKKEVLFDVTRDYLWDLFVKQNRKCRLTGREIIICGVRNKRTASLDRIDIKTTK